MTTRPGALLGTRVSVLAAEGADPDRFRRGRVLAREGAVLEVVVEPGVVTGTVQGSRRDPYTVELRVRPSKAGRPAAQDLVPRRDDLVARCSCPDDVPVCKHAVAVLLQFADGVAVRPELLATWRNLDPSVPVPEPEDAEGPAEADSDGDGDDLAEFFGHRHRWGPELVELTPLESPRRPSGAEDLEAAALDALDLVTEVLSTLYG